MNVFRLFLVVLSYSAIEPALADDCPNPLPVGQICCGYTVNVWLRGDPYGPPGSVRATDSQLVNSLAECRALARTAHDAEAHRYGCLLPLVASYVESPTPSPDGISVTQGFWNRYQEYRPGTIIRQDCLELTGSILWIVPPPPVACSIPDLPAIPALIDACTASLEANNGLPGPGCPAVPVMERVGGEPCWRRKVNEVGALYVAPTSTIRTAAYNKHLQDVWFKYLEHAAVTDPEQRQACAARRAKVEAEMSKHKIVHEPADNSNHLTGRAFDDGSIDFKIALGYDPVRMLRSSSTIPDSPACTLIWGGSWRKRDNVHFELSVP